MDDEVDRRIERDISETRRRELQEYAFFCGLKLTRQEEHQWDEDASSLLAAYDATREPTAAQEADCEKERLRKWRETMRMKENAPRTPLEYIYVDREKLRFQQEKTQRLADDADRIGPAVEALNAATAALAKSPAPPAPAVTPPTEPDPRIDAALKMLRAKRLDPAACRAAELYLMGKRGNEAGAAMVDAHNKPRRMTREGWRKALRRFCSIAGLDPAVFEDTFRQHARRKGTRTQADLAEDIYDEVDRRLTSG